VRTKRDIPFPGKTASAIGWTLTAGFLLAAGMTCHADTNCVTAQSQIVTNQFAAYAQVEPISVLPVRAVQAGLVVGLEIVPGAAVHAGQKLAELGGPEIASLLAQDEAAVRSAQTNFAGTRKSLAVQRQELTSHLSTQDTVSQAQSAVAQAQANLDTAQTQLRALRQTITLQAPVDGVVLAVSATDGERVSPGETLLTLQPADKLWLKAVYYGTDAAAIQTGMTGQFSPADGGEPIAVKVRAVFGALTPAGGESVGLLAAASAPSWLNGEFGAVTLNGPVQELVAVPTRALILDQGQWWVLVHSATGNRPQVVTPGPARGWQTFIKRGLEPGAEVVVENAYLEFHQGISKNYQPPN
jgi:RND family efflux transporter MFP subunit